MNKIAIKTAMLAGYCLSGKCLVDHDQIPLELIEWFKGLEQITNELLIAIETGE